MDTEARIDRLRGALERDERVSAAILFGSAAQGTQRADSDIDIGLVARSSEDARILDEKMLDMTAALSQLAGRDVQVVVVDRVDPVLGRQIFLRGRVLFDRDPARTADAQERILVEYFDGEHHRRVVDQALDRRSASRDG